jgi:syntaxin 1B/2/3
MQKTRKTQRKIILNRRIHVSFTIHFKQTLASKLLKFTVQQDSASTFYFSRDYQFRSLFNYRSSTPKLLVISIFHFFSLFSFSLLFFFLSSSTFFFETMSVNRFAEFQNNQRNRQEGASVQPTGGYEMRPLLSTKGDISSLQGFLDEISHVKESITQINANVNRIKSYQSSMLQIADANELARTRQSVDDLTTETQNIMTHVKQKLKEIEPTARHTDLAIRKNTFSTVTQSFMESIENHRRVSLEFQKAEGQQLERQIKIANPNATPQEIQEAIAGAEQGRGAVFAQQLMQSVGNEYRRQNAQNTLDAVQERHEDIRRLAKSVQELSLLFQEMQEMLEAQKHVLDTVEQSAFESSKQIEEGSGHIEKAKVSAKATRRKKWICFFIFLIIIIILAIVLAIEIPKRSSSSSTTN